MWKYTPVSVLIFTHLFSGQWSSPTPRCLPHCAPLRYVPNGTITPELCYSANNNPGAVCNITCDNNDSHVLLGRSTRKCLEDGSWSGEESICISKSSDVFAVAFIYQIVYRVEKLLSILNKIFVMLVFAVSLTALDLNLLGLQVFGAPLWVRRPLI